MVIRFQVIYNPGSSGSFGVIDSGSSIPSSNFVVDGTLGTTNQFLDFTSLSQPDDCGTFPGVTTTSATDSVVPGTFSGTGLGGVSADGGVGFISLPSRQDVTFLGGQGSSFTSGQLFGQAGASGAGSQLSGFQVAGPQGGRFPSRVIQEQGTPTLTVTVTQDAFETLTDLVLHSVAVTRTQFSLVTTTRVITVVSTIYILE